MLGYTPTTGLKKAARCGDTIRRSIENLQHLSPGKSLMLLRQNGPNTFSRNSEGNENDLTFMTSHPIAPIGELRDLKLDRLCTGSDRPLQYQLSFRSAGG
jgi:hypothetical protein